MPAGWIAGAIVGSAVIGGISANAAAGQQADAANNATGLQSSINQANIERNKPFVDAGVGAVSRLADLEGTSGNTGAAGYGSLTSNFTPADFLANKDPGYDFALQTGENAVQSRDAATGSAIGGAALKDLNNFAQGTAATGYQSAFDRYQTSTNNVYQRLASLAGIGQASANNSAASGNAFGTNAGSNMIGAGNARAAGTVGVANSISGGLNNAAGYYSLNSLGSSGTPSVDGAGNAWGSGGGDLAISG